MCIAESEEAWRGGGLRWHSVDKEEQAIFACTVAKAVVIKSGEESGKRARGRGVKRD